MRRNQIENQYPSLQDFFTHANELRCLMVDLLGDVSDLNVLEPCAGDGAFIRDLRGRAKRIDAVDVHAPYVTALREQFGSRVNAIHADFLALFNDNPLLRGATLLPEYDAVICNPPYGLRIPLEYRRMLKTSFPDLYVRESYGLFIHFSLELLRNEGRYVFIVPDTFLTSTNHRSLRKALLRLGAPSHIIQFKPKRFGTVNFGYGNLCIIAGHRRSLLSRDQVKWIAAINDDTQIHSGLFRNAPAVPGSLLLDNWETSWTHPSIQATFSTPGFSQLSELADCRTGIYTGENVRFLGYDRARPPRRANGHPIDWSLVSAPASLENQDLVTGIGAAAHYVPLVRGGHRQPFEATSWAIDWSPAALHYYQTDRKARFQNATYYFKKGLAVPMVTAGRISASMLTQAVFDQGVVGVFPNNPRLLNFLLLYLNSSYVTRMKKTINPSANNSANYLKRILVPPLSTKTLDEANELVSRAKTEGWDSLKGERESFIERVVVGSPHQARYADKSESCPRRSLKTAAGRSV